MHVRSSLAIALFASAASSPIAAQPATVFTDRASWEAAASGVTTVDFEGIAGPGAALIYRSEGLLISGVSFLGTFDGGFYIAAADST